MWAGAWPGPTPGARRSPNTCPLALSAPVPTQPHGRRPRWRHGGAASARPPPYEAWRRRGVPSPGSADSRLEAFTLWGDQPATPDRGTALRTEVGGTASAPHLGRVPRAHASPALQAAPQDRRLRREGAGRRALACTGPRGAGSSCFPASFPHPCPQGTLLTPGLSLGTPHVPPAPAPALPHPTSLPTLRELPGVSSPPAWPGADTWDVCECHDRRWAPGQARR